jgi:ABC-type polysaccharide/polyol phosphate transport system ATPase subunit
MAWPTQALSSPRHARPQKTASLSDRLRPRRWGTRRSCKCTFRMDFRDTRVIRDLFFDVHGGEIFGFLGSNGSGKTTTLRALLGIYRPSCRRSAACTRRNPSRT